MNPSPKEEQSILIRQKALDMGFAACGIAEAHYLETEKQRLESWLKLGYQGNMKYLEDPVKRSDPGLILEGARSVVSLAYNYFPVENSIPQNTFRIASYALGKSYQQPIKNKLEELAAFMQTLTSSTTSSRTFVDSAPMLERAWARRSHLGWIGKNACLIVPKTGSFVLIGEIITTMELAYDEPFEKDLCGSCRLCIDSCPTRAIVEPHVIKATHCISYITQKPHVDVPPDLKGSIAPWIYGCDICQEVCPHNREARPGTSDWLEQDKRLANFTREQWESFSREDFEILFGRSSVLNLGYEGFRRNIMLASVSLPPSLSPS